jgi:hypothetical protein
LKLLGKVDQEREKGRTQREEGKEGDRKKDRRMKERKTRESKVQHRERRKKE